MAIPAKKAPKMQCYNDGVCTVWAKSDNKTFTERYKDLRFADLVVGMARYFTAMQDQFIINRLIRVPRVPDEIMPFHDIIVISGKQYEIIQVQQKPDILPPSIDITLKQAEQFYKFRG